jgi:hypothetical protein
MTTLTNPEYRVISEHGIAQRRQRLYNNQNALFALQSFHAGDVIADFHAGTISTEPTYLTVQVDTDKHITLQPEYLQYINHSCDPNVFFDTTTMQLIALREISAQQEMTFFYPSTEWEMVQPFSCYCGSSLCLGQIRGAAYLTKNVAKQYRLTDFIQQQISRRSARKVRA